MERQFFKNILALIFPPVCGYCKEISSSYLCNDCKQILKKLEQNVEIDNTHKYVDSQFWIFDYKDEIRSRMIEYKFNDASYLYRFFSELILSNERAIKFIEEFDFIIPVPLHKRRLRKRGYNQTALIAKKLANSNVRIKFYGTLLKKVKNTKAQSTLDKEQRALNIKDAFAISDDVDLNNFKDKKILLFDDIHTTGSTLAECAKIIKSLKPRKIGIFTIAKD